MNLFFIVLLTVLLYLAYAGSRVTLAALPSSLACRRRCHDVAARRAAFGAASFVVRLFLQLIVHRVSEWKMMIGAMFAGATLVICLLVNEPLSLMGLAFLPGLGLGGAQPMIMALLYSTAPHGRGGEAIGVRTLLLNSSQTSIPLPCSVLGTALGMGSVFWTMALALVAGGRYACRD